MLTTIEGIYDNGVIKLGEIPPGRKKARVLITFLEDPPSPILPKKERQGGGLAGKVWMSEDFNEPLEDLSDYM